MNRMQKIVSRAKQELEVNEKSRSGEVRSREKLESNLTKYEYTKTRVIPITGDILKRNRIISMDKTDLRAVRFQMLRSKVLQQMRKKEWNTLGITAPTSGAGKSLISVNLACSIAMEGNQSVLLVDMDLRKPSVNKYFELAPEYGMHDIIEGNASIAKTLINPGIDRLTILPGVKGVLNSSEQISTPFVKELITSLKERYSDRIVIFDLPPALAGDDVMVFIPYIDCSLLVIESGGNKRHEIEDSLNLLKEKPVLGTVLNRADTAKDTFY